MNTGALIFAHNNKQIDYVAMAAWSAKNIKRHLGIPVCLVTDQSSVGIHHSSFDSVIYTTCTETNTRHFADVGNVQWHNTNRVDAYEITPWQNTLVLDADYVVASDQLKTLFDCDQDFMCHRWAMDITGLRTFEDLNYFGRHRFPQWWATVIMFRKSARAEAIFTSMRMIKQHWRHYLDLYGNTRGTYRNDHALSIALNIENGHTLLTTDIPWQLPTITPEHRLTQLEPDRYRVDFVSADRKPRFIEFCQDFHAMGKQQLGDIVATA